MWLARLWDWLRARRGRAVDASRPQLAAALDAVLHTASDTGRGVNIGLIADRLMRDFPEAGLSRADVRELVRAACASRPGVAVFEEDDGVSL